MHWQISETQIKTVQYLLLRLLSLSDSLSIMLRNKNPIHAENPHGIPGSDPAFPTFSLNDRDFFAGTYSPDGSVDISSG